MKNIKLRIVYLILGAAADLLPECLPRAENAAYGDTLKQETFLKEFNEDSKIIGEQTAEFLRL